jgi:hypothetical protein
MIAPVSSTPHLAEITAARGKGAVGGPERVGKEFEAMVLGQMFEAMFAGIKTGGAFGGGHAEATWRSFMIQEYGRAVADAGGLGIGDMVHAEVARLYGQDGDGK